MRGSSETTDPLHGVILTVSTPAHPSPSSYRQVYYNDTRIQLLDLPGIIEGAAYGKGRGREVRGEGWRGVARKDRQLAVVTIVLVGPGVLEIYETCGSSVEMRSWPKF